MTVELRPHHLLCILTYVGEGYGPAFVRRFDEAAARLAGGEDLAVIEGPDELCRAHLAEAGEGVHCTEESVRERDRLARAAVADVLGGLPERLDAATVAALRAAFGDGRLRAACAGCPWDGLCTGIAAGGFAGARLRPPGPGSVSSR
jgi:uncharacterized protein